MPTVIIQKRTLESGLEYINPLKEFLEKKLKINNYGNFYIK